MSQSKISKQLAAAGITVTYKDISSLMLLSRAYTQIRAAAQDFTDTNSAILALSMDTSYNKWLKLYAVPAMQYTDLVVQGVPDFLVGTSYSELRNKLRHIRACISMLDSLERGIYQRHLHRHKFYRAALSWKKPVFSQERMRELDQQAGLVLNTVMDLGGLLKSLEREYWKEILDRKAKHKGVMYE